MQQTAPILFFDGVCILCNQSVQFVIKHDKPKLFRFATLQSAAGAAAKTAVQASDADTDTVILLYKGRYYTKSDAVLRVATLLGWPWRLAVVGYAMPRFLRNAIYSWVASNRYKWFGKKNECMLPTAATKARFLSQ